MGFARRAGRIFFIGLGLIFPFQGFGDVAGGFMVLASDSSSPTNPPPQTTATLDGTENQAYGSNDLITFSGYYEIGIHTVEVATASSGYLLRESPTDPNAVNDPTSEYGNPRHVEISQATNFVSVGYQFDPVVMANATVRDAWTMERLEDASIEFVINSGSSSNTICKNYPWMASYASNWVSDTEGNFPSNTYLYATESYDLNIAKSGYQLFTSNNIITNALPGDAFDFGTLFLYPIDNNTNQIADAWETLYFGSGSNVVTDADADEDRMSNRDEYVTGTDPTNWYSCLWLESIAGSNSFHLAWYTEPDRTYRISGTTNLCADTWIQVAGPWEATNGQIEIFWAETNHNLSWNNSYRVEVVPCWWQGTNQVLIRTNDWPTGGGGTNTWGGGIPPFP